MNEWPGDGSVVSADQVVQLEASNRSWGRQLRAAAADLVNQRLAKAITQEDYIARRSRCKADAGEHQRRAAILAAKRTRLS